MSELTPFRLPDAAAYPQNRLVVPQFIEPHWRTRQQQPLAAGTIEYVIYEKHRQRLVGSDKEYEYWQEVAVVR